MQRDIDAILKDIEDFQPQEGNWRPLDDLLIELWETDPPSKILPILFGVFERFPDEDGAGVLWTIVHGVESLEHDYEVALRRSLAIQKSEMGELMLDRLERSKSSSKTT